MQTFSYLPLNRNIVGLGGQVHKENQMQYRSTLFNQTHKNEEIQNAAYSKNEYIFKKPIEKKLLQNKNNASLYQTKSNLLFSKLYFEKLSKESEQFSNESSLTDISSKNIISTDNENYSKNRNAIKEYKNKNKNDPQFLTEYADEILLTLIQDQNLNKAKYQLMDNSNINEASRNKLINWLIFIQNRFNLLDETLMLTVNMIDRLIFSKKINQDQLQLYGLSCLYIASKYQEIYPPDIYEFHFFVKNKFTRSDILQTEIKIMSILNYSLETVSPLLFLEFFWKVIVKVQNKNIYYLTKMLIELCLFSPKMLKYNYSLLVASSMNMAFKITKKIQDLDFESLCYFSENTKDEIHRCNLEFYNFSKTNVFTSRKNEILKKYSKDDFLNVGQKFMKVNN